MKRYLILIALFLLTFSVIAESLDSLKSKRERLYQKYSDLNIPGKETKKENLQKTISILKDIVIVDTKIIRENAAFDAKLLEYEKKIKALTDDKTELEKKLAATTDKVMVIYIFGGVLVVITVLLLVILMRRKAGAKAAKSDCCG